MDNKKQIAIYRQKLKLWVVLSAGTLFVYGGLLLMDAYLFNGSAETAWVSILAGAPIIIAAVLVYFFIPRFHYMPFFVGVSANITFLLVGSYLQYLDFYFIFMLVVAGTITTVKNFRQMLLFTLFSTIINILAIIFHIPFIDWYDSFTFTMYFAIYSYGLLFFLIITRNVASKEGASERALAAFSSLLRSTPNLMIITNAEGKVLYLSDPMADFIRYPHKEYAVGQPLADLAGDDALKAMFADMLDADGYYETIREFDIRGRRRHFKIIADKLSGEAEGIFIDIADITSTVSAQMAAEEANKSKSGFLATVSHEIRTPMNAIIGITQIELQNSELPQEYAASLQKIYASGNNLLGIINDILDMSKIETGKLELIPVNYDIPSLVNDAVQMNIMRIGSKFIELILEIDENLPSRFIGDELRLKQILNNLLSNAIKYTDRGHVKLIINHFYKDEDVYLRFIIEDTGQGMKPEDLEKLFSEYSRFNVEANRATEGTGIGMNITKNLLEMMDGTIDVESEYGKGSTFTVAVKQKAVACEVIGTELSKQLRNFTFTTDRQMARIQILREPMPYGRVLIVDDVDTNLYVAQGLLAPYKLATETANSGFTAIEKVEAGEVYDIIFMDHMMPLMDGVETTKKLRDGGYRGIIVALTANALVGNDEMFRQNGFDGFIAKPIDLRQLNEALNKFVRDRHPDEAKKYKAEHITAQPKPSEPDAKLLQVFRRDAEKAAVTLHESAADMNISLFTTTVHAMKAALANIGENEKSAMAFALEEAGLRNDTAFISANTGDFINVLETLVTELSPEKTEDSALVTEDTAFLNKQMQAVIAACEEYDDTEAYAALDRLKEMQWAGKTRGALDELRDLLFLGSDFEGAAEKARQILISLT